MFDDFGSFCFCCFGDFFFDCYLVIYVLIEVVEGCFDCFVCVGSDVYLNEVNCEWD